MKNVPQYDCPLVPFLERKPRATQKTDTKATCEQTFLMYKKTSRCIKISFKDLYILLFQIFICIFIYIVHLDSQFKCITSLTALLKIYAYCSFNDLYIFSQFRSLKQLKCWKNRATFHLLGSIQQTEINTRNTSSFSSNG